MKKQGYSGVAAVLAAALVWATMPAAPARAETGSDSVGAAVTAGLMIAIVATYGLVTLRSDVERYSEADVEDAIARAAKAAEESPIVLQAVTAPVRLDSAGNATPAEVAGAAIGWRVTF